MKKGKIFIVCFLLFFSSLYEDNKCYAFINSSCIVVPKEGQNFFKQNYKDLILSVNEYQDIFGVKINDVDNLFIGDTFVIYHLNKANQDMAYYYPIYNSSSDLILVLELVKTSDNWSLSVSNSLIEQLRLIPNINDFVIYSDDKVLVAENKRKKIFLSGVKDESSIFSGLSFEQKKNIINYEFNNSKEVCIEQHGEKIIKYTPQYATNTTDTKICALINAQNQKGVDGMCWAASVATIYNYVGGHNTSPYWVCNKMGIGPDVGASFSQCKKAINSYGLSYNVAFENDVLSEMDYSKFKKNINHKRPVFVHAVYGTEYSHAVVFFGYCKKNSKKASVFFDPATSKSTIVTGVGYGTVISSGTINYCWQGSISKY